MLDPFALGPLNSVVLLVLVLVASAVVARSLRRLHHAEPVGVVPLAVSLALPLAFAIWASNGQLAAAMADAATHERTLLRQTLMAMALHRALLTQLVAGGAVALLAAGLMAGALGVVVEGERPRLALGEAGLLLGGALVAVSMVGFAVSPSLVLAWRVVLYVAAAFVAVTGLIATHRRGPGVQLGALVGIGFPLLVAGVDQATIAWLTHRGLEAVAAAAPPDRQALMNGTVASVESLRAFSAVHLGLATGLALLGPAAAWRTERPLAVHHLAAVGAGVLMAAVGVGWASRWLVGF